MNGYHTVLNSSDCLTDIICDTCQARCAAGTKFIHFENCAKTLEVKPRRKFKEIDRIVHYKIQAEIENGILIIP